MIKKINEKLLLKLKPLIYFGYKMALHSIIFNNRYFRNTLICRPLRNCVFQDLLLFYYNSKLFLALFIVILPRFWDMKIYIRYKKWKSFWALLNSILKANPGIPDAYPYNRAYRGIGVLSSGYGLLRNRGHT